MLERCLPALLVALCSCTYAGGDPHVIVTSTPGGAEILLDGEPTGLTTPAKLELGGIAGREHTVIIHKEGFQQESREFHHYTTTYTSRWIDGASEEMPSFPIFWTFGDLFLPFGIDWRYVPHEIHVVLYKSGEAPVTENPDQGRR